MADFKIAYDGTWFHEGMRIERVALAKLFSDRALKIDEEGQYWLQAPFEKYPVDVEDVPYIIVDFQEHGSDLDLVTNMDEIVALGPEHPLELRADRYSGETLPYVNVRGGLYARLGRPVYYNLIEKYGPAVKSRGMTFPLGKAAS
jgi:uncharacterized protein